MEKLDTHTSAFKQTRKGKRRQNSNFYKLGVGNWEERVGFKWNDKIIFKQKIKIIFIIKF